MSEDQENPYYVRTGPRALTVHSKLAGNEDMTSWSGLESRHYTDKVQEAEQVNKSSVPHFPHLQKRYSYVSTP